MATDTWIQPDEFRATWGFLILGSDSEPIAADATIQYWEFGIANPNQLVEIHAERMDHDDVESEAELVSSLLDTLFLHRYQGTILVVLTRPMLNLLRRKMLEHIQRPSLRGFDGVIVEQKIRNHLDQSLSDYELDLASLQPPRIPDEGDSTPVSNGATRKLWEQWIELYQLFPESSLAGDQL